MTPLTHFVVGAAVSRCSRWRLLGLGLAVLSHFVLDAIPHFGRGPSLGPFGRVVAPAVIPLTGVLVLVVVLRLWMRARSAPERRMVGVLVLGGLLGCLSDVLVELFGDQSLPGRLDDLPPRLWEAASDAYAQQHGVWSPFAAPLQITLELIVLAVSGWLLFRPLPAAERPAGEGD